MLVKDCTGKEYDASQFWVEVERMEGVVYYFLFCEYRCCYGSKERTPLFASRNQEETLDRLEELRKELERDSLPAGSVL